MNKSSRSAKKVDIDSIEIDLLDPKPKSRNLLWLWIVLAVAVLGGAAYFLIILFQRKSPDPSPTPTPTATPTPTTHPWEFEKYFVKETGELTFPKNLDWPDTKVVISKHDGIRKITFLSSSFTSVVSLEIKDLSALEMIEISGSNTLASMTTLSITQCTKLVDFSINGDHALSKLPFSSIMNLNAPIRRLMIYGSYLFTTETTLTMEKQLISLESITFEGDHFFTSAESLKIIDMALKSLTISCWYCFNAVKSFSMDKCNQLSSISFNGESLFENVASLQWTNLDALKSLTVYGDDSFTRTELKLENFKSLEKVHLSGDQIFNEKTSMTFKGLPSLSQLLLYGDRSFGSIAALALTDLPALSLFRIKGIGSFGKIESLKIEHLPSLKQIEFIGSSLMSSLSQFVVTDVEKVESLLVDGMDIAPDVSNLSMNVPSMKSVTIQGDHSFRQFLVLSLDGTTFASLVNLTIIQPQTTSPVRSTIHWTSSLHNVYVNQRDFLDTATSFELNYVNLRSWRIYSDNFLKACTTFSMAALNELEVFEISANNSFGSCRNGFSFSNLPKLRSLRIGGNQCGTRFTSLEILKNPLLEEVHFWGNGAFTAVLTLNVKELNNLRRLTFDGWNIFRDVHTFVLTNVTKLEYFNITAEGSFATMNNFEFPRFDSLKELLISGQIIFDELDEFCITYAPELQRIVLKGAESFRDCGFFNIQNADKLELIEFDGYRMFTGLTALNITNLPSLKEISIDQTYTLGHVDVLRIENLPKLTTIQIRGESVFHGVSDLTLKDLPELTSFNITRLLVLAADTTEFGMATFINLPKAQITPGPQAADESSFYRYKILRRGQSVADGFYNTVRNHIKAVGLYKDELIEETI